MPFGNGGLMTRLPPMLNRSLTRAHTSSIYGVFAIAWPGGPRTSMTFVSWPLYFPGLRVRSKCGKILKMYAVALPS